VLLYALSLLGILLGSMTLHLVMPACVRAGEGVPITLRLTNPDRRAADVYLQGRPAAFDIVVTRRDGTPVWRRLEGAVIPAVLQVRQLTPPAQSSSSTTPGLSEPISGRLSNPVNTW
jgi:hypothetical protein